MECKRRKIKIELKAFKNGLRPKGGQGGNYISGHNFCFLNKGSPNSHLKPILVRFFFKMNITSQN